MKYIFLIVTSVVLFGCTSAQTKIEKQQYVFLTKQLDEAVENLKNSVEGSGNRYEGVQFYKKSLKLKDKVDSIKIQLKKNNLDSAKKLVSSLAEFSQLKSDSIRLNTDLILEPLAELSESESDDFINSLLLYSIDVVQKYRDKFNSYFLKYDFIDVMVVPKNLGSSENTYEAEVFLRATRSAIYQEFEYKLASSNTDFVSIPVNGRGIGELKIKDLPVGQSEYIIRVTDMHNNDTITFKQSIIIEN